MTIERRYALIGHAHGAGSIDHGTLAGLSDNDHPQYGLLNKGSTQTWQSYQYFQDGISVGFGYAEIQNTGAANPVAWWFYNEDWSANDKYWSLETSNDGHSFGLRLYQDSPGYQRYDVIWATKANGVLTNLVYGNSTQNPDQKFYSDNVTFDLGSYTWLTATSDGATASVGTLITVDSNVYSEFQLRSFVNDTYGPTMTFYHSRGTKASPSQSLSGDQMGGFYFGARHESGDWHFPAAVDFTLSGNSVAATGAPGTLDFKTGLTFATLASRLAITTSGEVRLGTDVFIRFDEHSSAPSTPAAGNVALYAKADGKLYIKDDTGTETDLTSSGTVTRQVGASWGGSSALVAASCADVIVRMPVSGTITGVYVLTQGGTGSCVIDIWKDTYANYPPTVADTITAAAKPTISSSTKYSDTTLTGWTKSITAGDILIFHVDSTSTFTNINVYVTYQ